MVSLIEPSIVPVICWLASPTTVSGLLDKNTDVGRFIELVQWWFPVTRAAPTPLQVCARLSVPHVIVLLRQDFQPILSRGGSPREGGLQAARRVGGNDEELLRCVVQGDIWLNAWCWEETRLSSSGSSNAK